MGSRLASLLDPRLLRPGIADVVFLMLSLGILQTATHSMLDDPGLGWHLRNLDAMWEKGGWLTEDPFAGPRGGQPWRTNQWLGELPLRLGEWWGGLDGIAVVNTLLIAFTLRCLYVMLVADGLPWPAAVGWTYLAALGTSCSWLARPNVFTMLFVLLTARVCERFHRGHCSRGATWWLVPLFAVWANTHGGFVAGLILMACTLLVEAALSLAAPDSPDRQAARERLWHWTLLSAAVFAGTLLNPYGVSLYSWILKLLGDPYFMELHVEWKSPDFHSEGAFRYELLLLLLPGVLCFTRRKPNLVELSFVVVWLHFALNGFRYVPLWVLVVVPVLARASMAIPWLERLGERFRLSDDLRDLVRPRPGPVPWFWSVAIALGFLGWAHWGGGFARHNPERIPARALEQLLAMHRQLHEQSGQPVPVFHFYNWGGYLIWHGWRDGLRVWIDDRNEVHGQAHTQEYFDLIDTRPGWEAKLNDTGVQLVCVPPGSALAQRLEGAAGWERAYRDDYAVIHRRRPSE